MDGIDVAICRVAALASRVLLEVLGARTVAWEPALAERLRAAHAARRARAGAAEPCGRRGVRGRGGRAGGRARRRAGPGRQPRPDGGARAWRRPRCRSARRRCWPSGWAARWSPISARTTSRPAAAARPWSRSSIAGCWPGPGVSVLALNIGGITNLTALPPREDAAAPLIGFDCGPGNMVLDELARRRSGGAESCDRDGRLAAAGTVDRGPAGRAAGEPRRWLRRRRARSAASSTAPPSATPCSRARPPGDERAWCDLFATVTELTVQAVAMAYRRFVLPSRAVSVVVVERRRRAQSRDDAPARRRVRAGRGGDAATPAACRPTTRRRSRSRCWPRRGSTAARPTCRR